jgi:hypothetical protein
LWALRGNPAFSDFMQSHPGSAFLLIGVNGRQGAMHRVHAMVHQMDRHFGIRNVLYIDNLFDKGHMLQQTTQDLSFVLLAIPSDDFTAARTAAEAAAKAKGLTPHLSNVPAADDPQDLRIFKAILGAAGDMV